MAVMPMFPLGTVLLPGVVLPLFVFEPRYQQLVRDCLESAGNEFGVVLIDRGSEVGDLLNVLDARGIGDVTTLTVREYRALITRRLAAPKAKRAAKTARPAAVRKLRPST